MFVPKYVCAQVCLFYCMPNNNRLDGPDGPVPRFQRNFVSCGPAINICYGCGMRFNALDAAHSKHSIYRQGYLHCLSTRDGDNKNTIVCWATCETESGDTYEWFGKEVKAAGLKRYMNSKSMTYSDRAKGLEEFHRQFKSHPGRCIKHIIKNAHLHLRGSGQKFQDKTIFALQAAETKAEWDEQLEVLRQESQLAAEYFEELDHDQVYQYAFNKKGVVTHGHKTSNIAESANSFLNAARFETPYRLNDVIAAWLGKEFAKRTETMRKWLDEGHFLTPYTHNLFATEVCAHMPRGPMRIGLCPHLSTCPVVGPCV